MVVAVSILACNAGLGADDSYLEMDLFVSPTGSVFFYGQTSIETGLDPDLGNLIFEDGHFSNTTDSLTSKIGRNWTFDFDIREHYAEGWIRVYLPEGAEIADAEGGNWSLISVEEDGLLITFLGPIGPEVGITIEYHLEGSFTSGIDAWAAVPVALIAVAVAAAGAKVLWPRFGKAGGDEEVRIDQSKYDAIVPTLTERERKVLRIVIDEGGRVSQRKLRHLSEIPKSSLSRITDELQRKELIRKIPVGQTNEIRVNSELLGE